MSTSNDLVSDLHIYLARMTWAPDAEYHRQDVLHIMNVEPIQIKMFGLLLKKKEMRNRLFGMVVGIISISAKFLAEIIRVY